MGFSLAWIAIAGKPADRVLAELALTDTGIDLSDVPEAPVCGAELPGDWFLLVFEDVSHPFVQPAALERLSRGCMLVVCQAEEHVMMSVAAMYKDGTRVWEAMHNSDEGLEHLDVQGTPPHQLEVIRSQLLKELKEKGGADYLFDVPVALAASYCGYRHDASALEGGGSPRFRQLEPA